MKVPVLCLDDLTGNVGVGMLSKSLGMVNSRQHADVLLHQGTKQNRDDHPQAKKQTKTNKQTNKQKQYSAKKKKHAL